MQTHRPPHIHPDTSVIFLTGRTYSGISWLHPEKTKEYFYSKLFEILPKYKLELDAWVICNNHHHLLLRVPDGKQIPKFVKHLHGSTAHHIKQSLPNIVNGEQILTREITPWDIRQTRRINSANTNNAIAKPSKNNVIANFNSRLYDPKVIALLKAKAPPIWYQYMDHVIRNDEDYYKHLNYIHQNPVKHGYTQKMTKYKWSSIHEWTKDKGKEFVVDCFKSYSIIDFEPVAD